MKPWACLLGIAALAWGTSGLLAAPAGVTGGFSQTFRGDSAKLTVEMALPGAPRFGFAPVKLAIDNQLPQDVRWDISFSSTTSTGNGALSVQSSDTLPIPGGRSHERWIFIPRADVGLSATMGYYFSPVVVNVSGPGIGDISFTLNTSGGVSPNTMTPWAVSTSLESAVRARIGTLEAQRRPSPSPRVRAGGAPLPPPPARPMISHPYNIFPLEPTQPMGDWRIWSAFSRVIMRTGEYEVLDGANRVALRNWIALGGVLYLSPEAKGPGATEYLGAGRIVTLVDPLVADVTDDAQGLFTADGLMRGTLAQPPADEMSLARTGLTGFIPGVSRAGDWLVYFFIGFAVLVAPVNLFALAPTRRRHRLFFTVPILSLLAVAGLMTAILLQDGFGGQGARRALVLLLPGDNQAVVVQEQVSRTGMLTDGRFAMPDDVIFTQLPIDGNTPQGSTPSLSRGSGFASGDWFRSRAGQGQHLRRLVPTRARVERVGTAPDGAPIVQSSVGTTLRDFRYVDAQGAVWRAETVPAGNRITLEPLDNTKAFENRMEVFSNDASVHFRAFIRSSTMPGGMIGERFVAIAGDFDLAPLPTLDQIRWKSSEVLVTGALEAAETRTVGPGKVGP